MQRIVAAGDCAAPSGQPLRMSCQAAGPLGTQAADTVLSRIAGERTGRHRAEVRRAVCQPGPARRDTLQFTHEDDAPARFYLGGRVAASVKEAICKGTLWGLRREARKPGSAFVFKGSKRVEEPAVGSPVVTNP